ncbi:MAG: restriction endonuclease [Candidatus Aenigmarchaeota archaeon]|nr:restriction endonuclease [Candidatus Aenigmarchaeota archaeon]
MPSGRVINVTKFDGSLQPLDRAKIARTCVRMGADPAFAEQIAARIEADAYEGITTKRIMQMIFSSLRRRMPEMRHRIDMRTAMAMMRPKPDFELFAAQLLRAYGYRTQSNRIIRGRYVEHEIDAIAENGKDVFYVEVKHHVNAHTFMGVDVALQARATFEDLVDGHKDGMNRIPFTKAMLFTNAKMSDHAMRYADGRGIRYISWDAPEGRSLGDIIDECSLYPITLMRDLDSGTQAMLGDAGIVTLLQLVDTPEPELLRRTHVRKDILRMLVHAASELLNMGRNVRNP